MVDHIPFYIPCGMLGGTRQSILNLTIILKYHLCHNDFKPKRNQENSSYYLCILKKITQHQKEFCRNNRLLTYSKYTTITICICYCCIYSNKNGISACGCGWKYILINLSLKGSFLYNFKLLLWQMEIYTQMAFFVIS